MRATVVFVTALLVVGVAAPFVAAAPGTDGVAATTDGVAVQDDDTSNGTDNETAPGAKLAGVAEVQGAEVEGEIETRSFGLQVAAANSNASKASVVAQQAETIESRLAELTDRKAELEAARENGSITKSRYRAEIAGLAARISTLQGLSNETADVAKGLPAEALAERGVNTSAIERVRTSAGDLSGPEVASVARDIAGPPSGTGGPPVDVGGPPGIAGPGENNTTTGGPGVGTGNGPGGGPPGENATNGNGPGAPGNGSDTPGNGPDAVENGTDAVENGADIVENGTDTVENGTDIIENGTDTTVDDDVVDATVAIDVGVRFGAAGFAPLFAGE